MSEHRGRLNERASRAAHAIYWWCCSPVDERAIKVVSGAGDRTEECKPRICQHLMKPLIGRLPTLASQSFSFFPLKCILLLTQ